MFEMIAYIFFGYLDYPGKFFCGICPFFEKGSDVMADRLVSLRRFR